MGMSQVQQEAIYRTSSERTVKMMVIMLGICIAGGAIFFGMWDYWISQLPAVVAQEIADSPPPAIPSGEDIPVSLNFVESDDLLTLGFNAITGEPDANPIISAKVGDRIIFDVTNAGRSFHSFGVTSDEEGISGIFTGTDVASPLAPLLPGEGGVSEFVPTAEGIYYYICTVAGHREQGMVGMIEVGPAEISVAAAPTGVSHDFSLDMLESSDLLTMGFDAVRGEPGSNPEIVVNSGDEVTITITNAGRSFHSFGITVDPDDITSALWGSEIASSLSPLLPGESDTTTFTAGAPGRYYYICTVAGHSQQGMQGSFTVN